MTSSENLALCKKVADTLIREMALLGLGKNKDEGSDGESDPEKENDTTTEIAMLEVEQVRILAAEDETLKVAYPAKNDLEFPDIRVVQQQ